MNDNPVFTQIQQEVDDNDVVLFMKGTPMFPLILVSPNAHCCVALYWGGRKE